MKYTIIKYGKEERENLLKKDNFRKKCCILTNKKYNQLCLIYIIYILIVIIFILSIFLIILIKNNSKSLLSSYKNNKVCLCTLGKKENKYAREFVEHYHKYGIDKIIIYDNNDLEGENFEAVLSDYIKDKYVEIKNFRGKTTIQLKILNDCYKNNNKIFDWFAMFDMDEFIFLKNFKNIKSFLNDKRFKRCNLIHLNRVFHTDNDQIYYKNRSLFQRFPKYKTKITSVKPIVRGHLNNINIKSQHAINYKYKACDGFGHYINQTSKKADFKYYYLDHFFFKSTEEYIEKINRGDCYYALNKKIKFNKIKFYFSHNKMTFKKINLLEKKTGINLNFFRNKLNNNEEIKI